MAEISHPSGRTTAPVWLAVGIETRLLARGCDRAVEDRLLAGHLAGPTQRLAFFASRLLGRFFVKATAFHFTKNALTLHLFLQDAEGLVDIVVADKNLQLTFLCVKVRRSCEAKVSATTSRAMSSPNGGRKPHKATPAGPFHCRDIRNRSTSSFPYCIADNGGHFQNYRCTLAAHAGAA